jgi:predicted AAA+ superfamily ATPase
MINREAKQTLLKLARGFPVIVLNGPRQSGKTTLARATFPQKAYVSLEDPDERMFAENDPRGFLKRFPEGAVLDEVQRCPDLFSYLQSRVDQEKRMGMFVLTGSQQFNLISHITQSLAGRAGIVQLLPFSIGELKQAKKLPSEIEDLIVQGMYPPVHTRDVEPHTWYANYVTTYIERDLRQLLSIKDLSVFQRFLKMCAARTGQLLNLSALGADCGISHNTAKAWLSVLEASYIAFLLKPHHRNFNKRLVKMPKLYFYDVGLAAYLLNIHLPEQAAVSAMRGPLFETFVISELLKLSLNKGLAPNLFFWRSNAGDEIDVVMEEQQRLIPVEIKAGQTVSLDFFKGLSKWQKIAGDETSKGVVIYAGDHSYERQEGRVVSWKDIRLLGKWEVKLK